MIQVYEIAPNFLFLADDAVDIRRQFEFPAAQYFKTVSQNQNKTSVFLHKTEENVEFVVRVRQNG